ncbi:MAG: hypothetical protein ACK4PN_11820 [Allorhizobium sp.]
MKPSILALSALAIGLSVAVPARAAGPSAAMPQPPVIAPQGEPSAAGWRVEAALQEPQAEEGDRRVDVFEPRPIPQERLNIRRVGPRFYPDPANALDLGR